MMHWAHTDLDLGLFAPFKENGEAYAWNSAYFRQLEQMWGGPFEVVSRVRNNVIVRDLTNDAINDYDVRRVVL